MKANHTKRVLVTGGTGFVGRHAAASLQARGFEVHLVVRDPESVGAIAGDALLHQGDLFDADWQTAVVREVAPTHLLHLAWYTAHREFWTSPENFSWVHASLNLLTQFISHGGRRIVCAGTCAEYDWSGKTCSELSTPTRPATLYGACKNALREMVQQYATLHSVSSAWGRLFFLYGPHESPGRFVPSLIGSLLRGDWAECLSADDVRDFLHAADAADAFAALLDCDVQGPVNIASGRPLRLADVAQRIATIAGRGDRLRLATRPGSADNPLVLSADTKRLNQEVNWQPRIDLDCGLESVWQEHCRTHAEIDEPLAGSGSLVWQTNV